MPDFRDGAEDILLFVAWIHFRVLSLICRVACREIFLTHLRHQCLSSLLWHSHFLYISPHIIYRLQLLLNASKDTRGAFRKFCSSTIKHNGNVMNYTLYFFGIIPTEFNAFATFVWQTVNSTKIEIFGLSLQTTSLSISSSGQRTGVQKVLELGTIM